MLWLPIDSAFFSMVVLLAEGLEVLWGEDSPFLMGEVVLIGAGSYYFVAWVLVGWDRHKVDEGPKQEPRLGIPLPPCVISGVSRIARSGMTMERLRHQ